VQRSSAQELVANDDAFELRSARTVELTDETLTNAEIATKA